MTSSRQPITPPDTVIFDMDGTLFMSEAVGPEAARLAVARLYAEEGIREELPTKEHFLDQIGKPDMEYFSSLMPQRYAHLAKRLKELVIANELDIIEAGLGTPFPQARPTLAELKRRGYKLGIASNCGTRYFNAVCKACGFDELVDLRLCIGDRGFCSKAEIIRELTTTLDSRAAVLVGDRINDLQAARLSKIPFIGAKWGYGADDELAEADLVVESFSELLELLPGANGTSQKEQIKR